MIRTVRHVPLAFALSTLLAACVAEGEPSDRALGIAADDKIADAMSAAPRAIAERATIIDRPATSGAEGELLRAGTNGWTCTPSRESERLEGRPSPSCADENARAWFAAYAAQRPPQLDMVGFSYKLMGDNGASNIDPSASGPTADNEWVVTGPHVIIFVPDVTDLSGLPSDPSSGGPYVMWRDTPYAHVMMPVGAPRPVAAETR